MTDDEPPEPSGFDKFLQRHGTKLTTGSHSHEELDPPDWITDLDREICGLLGYGLILTPSVIAKNVDRPRSSVSRRLNTLEAGNIVEKVERGHYKLTEEGYAKMLEKVSMEELGEDLPDSQSWYTTKILTPNELKKRDENTD
jgi:hypothetical protein